MLSSTVFSIKFNIHTAEILTFVIGIRLGVRES